MTGAAIPAEGVDRPDDPHRDRLGVPIAIDFGVNSPTMMLTNESSAVTTIRAIR